MGKLGTNQMEQTSTVFVIEPPNAGHKRAAAIFQNRGYEVRSFDSHMAFLDGTDPEPSGCVIANDRTGGAAGARQHEFRTAAGNPRSGHRHLRRPEGRDAAGRSDLAHQIDQEIADKIAAGDASNPYNDNVIVNQLDEVVGQTSNIALERNRFSNEYDPANKIMPGVIEGTGHALVTDMFRKLTGADVGGLRGFRYTNSVLDGDDIDYASMYHMFPIGAQVAVAAIPTTPASEKALPTVQYYDVNAGCQNAIDSNCNGVVLFDQADNKRHFVGFPRSLQQEMELGMNSSHNPNIPAWGGGWSWRWPSSGRWSAPRR